MTNAAFSLLETVVAVFILLCAFCVFAALQNFSLVSSAKAERRTVAARVARNRLEELRAWAAQGTNFDAGDWTALANPVTVGGYATSVHLLESTLYSPSTTLSNVADPIDLTAAIRRVRVHVAYGSDGLDVLSQVGAPRGVPYVPNDRCILVTLASTGMVPMGGSVDLTAVARATSGPPLAGMVYKWGVLAGSGSGTVVVRNTSGSLATFINEIRTSTGVKPNPAPGPKNCRVIATAYYAGKELSGFSGVISLQTP